MSTTSQTGLQFLPKSRGSWSSFPDTTRAFQRHIAIGLLWRVHCLTLDAYNEVAVLARAEAYAMRGQKATAVSMLDRYIQELAPRDPTLVLPATILRKRVLQHTAQTPTKAYVANEPNFVGRESQ